MEHVLFDFTFIFMLGIFFVSAIIQKYIKIPLPHSLIILSYLSIHYFPEFFHFGEEENFDHILFLLLPLLLMYDAIHLKWKDIKTYKYSILYLATVSVAISIFMGALLFNLSIFGVGLTIGAYIALFSMNMATDAISVSAIFSQFKVDHNIKVLVEGESLGNDATAMIAFYFIGLPWLLSGSFDISTIPMIALKLYGVSALIGLFIGIIGFYLFELFNSTKEELLIYLFVSYSSFALGEYFHVSGILSMIVAVILLVTLIEKTLKIETTEKTTDKKKLFKFLKSSVSTKANQEQIISTLDNLSILAIIFVYILVASNIHIEELLSYWREILIMFLVTTLIRMLSMAKFALIGKNFKAIDYVGFNGWTILTLAGIKGALSLVMLHAIPEHYEFYKLFENVTIGVILLSTFVYGFSLLFYMILKEKKDTTIEA